MLMMRWLAWSSAQLAGFFRKYAETPWANDKAMMLLRCGSLDLMSFSVNLMSKS